MTDNQAEEGETIHDIIWKIISGEAGFQENAEILVREVIINTREYDMYDDREVVMEVYEYGKLLLPDNQIDPSHKYLYVCVVYIIIHS